MLMALSISYIDTRAFFNNIARKSGTKILANSFAHQKRLEYTKYNYASCWGLKDDLDIKEYCNSK
jgi:hypothetical protein